ncbi:MAG: hypothetical protein FJ100_20785 [Deltaproteobacteria bacterium]|nr:hypothetical protein [Deltaproteobacteria bacterium]
MTDPSPPLGALLATMRAGRTWIAALPTEAYASVTLLPGSTIGAQFRHHLDYVEALLVGLDSGRVDYDGRARELACERDPAVALRRALVLEAGIERHMAQGALGMGTPLLVRECCDAHAESPWLPSTVGREVAAVLSHTVHHHAILAVTALSLGLPVDVDLALAPATRRHRNQIAQGGSAIP